MGHPTPVGLYPLGAGPGGILDMAGNVWEWCQDWYGPYEARTSSAPAGAKKGKHRVARGGSWFVLATYARAAFRDYGRPGDRSYYFGFRVVWSGVRRTPLTS